MSCRLPSGNITVVAMPRSGSSAVHLTNYIRQDLWWTEALHDASTWPSCVWTTKIKPFSGRVSQLMLENPNSIIGFQPIGHFLTIRILTELAEAANRTQASFDVLNPLTTGAHATFFTCGLRKSSPVLFTVVWRCEMLLKACALDCIPSLEVPVPTLRPGAAEPRTCLLRCSRIC